MEVRKSPSPSLSAVEVVIRVIASYSPLLCCATIERVAKNSLLTLILLQRANILKEVQIMRNLDHPNIVKLIDFSESRQYYYIVLELCPGGELFHQIVRLTYFSEELSRHVIVQVAEAIEYLHETSGVVHRFVLMRLLNYNHNSY